ncbi:MAG: AraC family transcriptional regulator [Clostridiales bacterium]|nr:AraC family transcriptional regulator [Clostridiales bacterium]
MEFCRVTEYGICDTHTRFPNMTITKDRHVTKFEFEIMISGDGKSFIDNNSCDLCSGLVLFRKPGSVSHSRLHFKAYYFYLYVDEKCEYYSKLLTLPNYFFSTNRNEYYAIFENLFKLFTQYGIEKTNDLINAELIKLFFYMDRDRNQNVAKQIQSKTYESIQPSLDYITANYADQITLEDIAKASGYSQFYFQKKFVEIMGISPLKYLTNARIAHAKRLLIDPQKSLVDIAYECGFPSQSYFCYLFKKNTDLTPTEYRKSTLGNYLI